MNKSLDDMAELFPEKTEEEIEDDLVRLGQILPRKDLIDAHDSVMAKCHSDEDKRNLSDKFDRIIKRIDKRIDKIVQAKVLMNKLEIPFENNKVDIECLYDILMDDNKLQKINSMLKNKIFW